MRFIATDGLRNLQRGLIALALSALTAGAASAQMVFDGNVLFNNNASGTLAGQFVGTAGAGAPACAAGFTAAQLGTVTYVHNAYADPLLSGAVYQANVLPDFQPGLGSPAYNHAMTVPADGFFEQTCYAGAVGPNAADRWWEGWTTFDSTGANRHDLHLGPPYDSSPRPLATYDNVSLYAHQYWSPDSNYLVRGQLRIKAQGSLSIAPSVVVFEEFATLGTIIVERGGQLWAVGNACEPIIITSDDPPGFMTRGHCGGIVVNGRAKVNIVNSCAGDSASSEGGAIGFYGGSDDNDGSGSLRYVRVEFSGKEITPNNELNSFTWNGCGRNTHGDYLEAFNGADDSFEWFGGTMDQKHLIGIDGTDDGYDWQLGTRNRAQFVIVRCSPRFAPSGTQNGDKGIEADDNEFDFNATVCSGRSNTTICNMTIIGDKRVGAAFPGPTSGVNFRRGTAGTFLNGVIYDMKTAALKIDDDATFQAHCVAPPVAPALYCPGALGVLPVTSGQLMVVRSSPNPFRSQVSFDFTLPRAGEVRVEIFSATGQRVAALQGGRREAGPQHMAWQVNRETPGGMYFYKVFSEGSQSTGKIVRLD